MSEHALAKKAPVPIDLKKIFRLETAPAGNGGGALHLGLALLFLVAVWRFSRVRQRRATDALTRR